MDIVYTLRNNYDGEELIYSLRSLKNIPHDRVFLVGGCPSWAQNIIHIPTEQTGTKWENSVSNIKTACKDSRLSDDFILMNDDFFILEPSTPQELNKYHATVAKMLEGLGKKHPKPTPYMVGMAETRDLLFWLGKEEPRCYELHIPFVFNKNKFLEMFKIPGTDSIKCLQIRTLYGNLYMSGGEDMPDVKICDKKGSPGQKGQFLSCSDSGFDFILPFLRQKFNNKTVYINEELL